MKYVRRWSLQWGDGTDEEVIEDVEKVPAKPSTCPGVQEEGTCARPMDVLGRQPSMSCFLAGREDFECEKWRTLNRNGMWRRTTPFEKGKTIRWDVCVKTCIKKLVMQVNKVQKIVDLEKVYDIGRER